MAHHHLLLECLGLSPGLVIDYCSLIVCTLGGNRWVVQVLDSLLPMLKKKKQNKTELCSPLLFSICFFPLWGLWEVNKRMEYFIAYSLS